MAKKLKTRWKGMGPLGIGIFTILATYLITSRFTMDVILDTLTIGMLYIGGGAVIYTLIFASKWGEDFVKQMKR